MLQSLMMKHRLLFSSEEAQLTAKDVVNCITDIDIQECTHEYDEGDFIVVFFTPEKLDNREQKNIMDMIDDTDFIGYGFNEEDN